MKKYVNAAAVLDNPAYKIAKSSAIGGAEHGVYKAAQKEAAAAAKAAARKASKPGMFSRAGSAVARGARSTGAHLGRNKLKYGAGVLAVGGIGGYYAHRKSRRAAMEG